MRIQLKIKNKMSLHATAKVAAVTLVLAFIIGCEKTGTSNYDPPEDHTISKDGFLHKSGLNEPMTNCISCHGDDLRSGTTGVSCYECHGKEW